MERNRRVKEKRDLTCTGEELETLTKKNFRERPNFSSRAKSSFKIAFLMHLTTYVPGKSSSNLEDSLVDLFVHTHICSVLSVILIIAAMEQKLECHKTTNKNRCSCSFLFKFCYLSFYIFCFLLFLANIFNTIWLL